MVIQLERPIEAEPTPVDRCWECDQPVTAEQQTRSLARYEGVICARCEPFVSSLLNNHTKEDQA